MIAPPRQPEPPAIATAAAEASYGPDHLRYGDGTVVDAANLAEVQAFQRPAAERENAPASKAVLQACHRWHVAS